MSGSTTLSSEEPPAYVRQFSNHPHADIILRTRDSHEFRVPKVYIIDSSPILTDLIRTSPYPSNPKAVQGVSTDAGTSLPVVQFPDSSCILSSLLSFIIPVAPPSSVDGG
jgi:hypothetical protein